MSTKISIEISSEHSKRLLWYAKSVGFDKQVGKGRGILTPLVSDLIVPAFIEDVINPMLSNFVNSSSESVLESPIKSSGGGTWCSVCHGICRKVPPHITSDESSVSSSVTVLNPATEVFDDE